MPDLFCTTILSDTCSYSALQYLICFLFLNSQCLHLHHMILNTLGACAFLMVSHDYKHVFEGIHHYKAELWQTVPK